MKCGVHTRLSKYVIIHPKNERVKGLRTLAGLVNRQRPLQGQNAPNELLVFPPKPTDTTAILGNCDLIETIVILY